MSSSVFIRVDPWFLLPTAGFRFNPTRKHPHHAFRRFALDSGTNDPGPHDPDPFHPVGRATGRQPLLQRPGHHASEWSGLVGSFALDALVFGSFDAVLLATSPLRSVCDSRVPGALGVWRGDNGSETLA